MAEALMANGKKRVVWPIAIGIVASIAIAVVGWVLLAQSWTKDAGHAVLMEKLSQNETQDVRQDQMLQNMSSTQTLLLTNQATILANQESFQKQLDRIEKKMP
jgi:hypothetical protein